MFTKFKSGTEMETPARNGNSLKFRAFARLHVKSLLITCSIQSNESGR